MGWRDEHFGITQGMLWEVTTSGEREGSMWLKDEQA